LIRQWQEEDTLEDYKRITNTHTKKKEKLKAYCQPGPLWAYLYQKVHILTI